MIIKKYDYISDIIITNINITFLNKTTVKNLRALWDTGSQITVVKNAIIKNLNLTPMYTQKVRGLHGITNLNVYDGIVNFPSNNIRVELIGSDKISDDIDMIIGMDVIHHGNFSIVNKDNKTTFTFELNLK